MMKEITLRKATMADLDAVVKNRRAFLEEMTEQTYAESFFVNTSDFLKRHMEENTVFCCLAEEDGKIVTSAIVCLFETIPAPSNESGVTGILYNVYTLPQYRGQGLATRIMEMVLAESRQAGIKRLLLSYTEQGRPLYEKLGFEHLDREMAITL